MSGWARVLPQSLLMPPPYPGVELPAEYVPLSIDAIAALVIEHNNAWMKHGDRAMSVGRMTDMERLSVLVEEVGEVAKELNEGSSNRRALVSELIQVAYCAIAWADSEMEGIREVEQCEGCKERTM